MKKKLIALLLCGGLIIGALGGCGSDVQKKLDGANNTIEKLNETIEANKKIIESNENDIAKKKLEISELNQEVDSLNDKIEEAEPWFEMKENEKEQIVQDNSKKEEEEKQAELDAQSVTLANGYFLVGTDIPAGTYNIEATSGGGNVISNDGTINAIMGVANDGFYQKEYNNIPLREGATLTVLDVTIKLTPSR